VKKVALVATLAKNLDLHDYDEYYGVDKGAYYLATLGIKMKYAIGDFDSVTPSELTKINEYSEHIITLNPIKDETDLEEALKLALLEGYQNIDIFGALGGRIDHMYANIILLNRYASKAIIALIDENNYVTCLTKQTDYVLIKDKYKYISLFTPFKAIVRLKGFKYSSEELHLANTDIIGVSNEIIDEQATISLVEGSIILIKSSDIKKKRL
jgi:thiamine pyrophosphokinase